jgi:hypothetical protein
MRWWKVRRITGEGLDLMAIKQERVKVENVNAGCLELLT